MKWQLGDIRKYYIAHYNEVRAGIQIMELCFVYLQTLAHNGCMVAAAWKNEP